MGTEETTRVQLISEGQNAFVLIDPGLNSAEASDMSHDLPGAGIEAAIAVDGVSTVQVAKTAIGKGKWLHEAAGVDARKIYDGIVRIRSGGAKPVDIPGLDPEGLE